MSRHNTYKRTAELTPELITVLRELSELAGITEAAVTRHLLKIGAPVFRSMLRRGSVPPDPLGIWRESLTRDLL